jgi:glycine/D-amino acid oxidase-like deaminating enzyme
MTAEARRVIIVGAGVTGLLTAIRCVRAGHRVTVLDRGDIPNPGCSSFDQHRVIRALGAGDVAATRRMAGSHRRWLDLENLLDARLYRRVGVVTAWPADERDAIVAVAAEAGVATVRVDREQFPHLTFPAGSALVLERNAGVLLADRVLRAAVRWLVRRPAATLLPWRDVTAVEVNSGRVSLAGGATLGADLVLIATGPWSRKLVDLPMVLHRQTMAYLRPPENLARWWAGAPSAGRAGADGRAWLLPPGDGTLLKISSAAACREVDQVGDPRVDGDTLRSARLIAASILTDADRYTVVALKRCHYLVDATTGGGHLVRLGPTVWARGASGGDGFRTAPLVADRIAEAVSGASGGTTARRSAATRNIQPFPSRKAGA